MSKINKIFDGINDDRRALEARSIENMESAKAEIEKVTGDIFAYKPVPVPKEKDNGASSMQKLSIKQAEPSPIIKEINKQHDEYMKNMVTRDWQGNIVPNA